MTAHVVLESGCKVTSPSGNIATTVKDDKEATVYENQTPTREKYPDVGCKRGYFVDTASTRVPRGRVCLFSGFGTPTAPDRTMSAFLVAVADSVDELIADHPEAFEWHHGQAKPTSYQRRCFAALRRDGFTLSDFRYWNADDDFSISALATKGDYSNRVAFPRTKAIEDYYQRQTYGV